MPQPQFLEAKEIASWLEMDVRTFRQYVRKGLFPRGVLFGSKKRRWSRVDAAWCAFVMIHQDRFRPAKPGETEDDDDDD